MTPSDICIVTVRDEPGVRFGNPASIILEELNPPFGEMMSGRTRQEEKEEERLYRIPSTRALGRSKKIKRNPVIALRKKQWDER